MPRTLTLAIAAALLYWLLGPVPESLIFDRSIPWYAEPWRLWTAHLTHSDLSHLTWDVAGLLLVAWIYEPLIVDRIGLRYWILLGGGAVLIDLAVLALVPELDRYCGLSGLVNLLVGAGTFAAAARPGNLPLVGFGLLVMVKVIYEQCSGDALLTNTHWPAVPEAHLVGLTVGAALAAVLTAINAQNSGAASRNDSDSTRPGMTHVLTPSVHNALNRLHRSDARITHCAQNNSDTPK